MPTKKPNKPQKNAFFFFMEDFKAQEARKGIHYKNFSEVANAAGPVWQTMTTEERRPYEMKKEENRSQRKEKKYTALGEDIALVNKQTQEIERMRKEMHQYIEDLVSDGNDYVNQTFHVAHINAYCYCATIKRYIPAEIAIVRFNLKHGVRLEDCYNVILDPGQMPVGYHLAAVTNIVESHQIPLPPHENDMMNYSERDIHKSYLNMTEFLRKNLRPREHLPPVYVDDININLAKDVFKNLHEEYDGDNIYNEVTVYSLSYLFYVLRNAAHSKVSSEKAFPFPTIPQAELEKDIYDFVKGISCNFHSVTDDTYPYCALSKCIRKVFIICDHTCYDLKIKLVPGRHIPRNASVENLQFPKENDWVLVKSHNHRSSNNNNNEEKGRKNVNSTAALQTNRNRNGAQTLPVLDDEDSKFNEACGYGNSTQAWGMHNSASSSNSANNFNNASRPLRKPQTKSMAMNIGPMRPPNFANDFPALGRPQSMGRGRGRMLQNHSSNN